MKLKIGDRCQTSINMEVTIERVYEKNYIVRADDGQALVADDNALDSIEERLKALPVNVRRAITSKNPLDGDKDQLVRGSLLAFQKGHPVRVEAEALVQEIARQDPIYITRRKDMKNFRIQLHEDPDHWAVTEMSENPGEEKSFSGPFSSFDQAKESVLDFFHVQEKDVHIAQWKPIQAPFILSF